MWMKTSTPLPQGAVSAIIALAWQGREGVLQGGGQIWFREPKATPGVSGFTTSGWVEGPWEGEFTQASAALSSRRKLVAVSSARGEGSSSLESLVLVPAWF